MEGNIKLNATVISCTGSDSDKEDFYFNGNFSNCHNTESIQCSFEKSLNNFIFAISDSIGIDSSETDGVSAIREIKKYHESAKTQQFALENIAEKIYESVQLSSNLIYSKSIIANQNSSILTGFSSVIIDNNRAVLMNLGNNGAFLYRHGEKKEIFAKSGSRKDEKLKMLGITPTSSDIYNNTDKLLKIAEEESKTKVRLSASVEIEAGDIILLCSDGLLNNVPKNRLEAVIDSGFEPSKMASILYHEATKNGSVDGVTIMVIRVEEIRNITYIQSGRKINNVTLENEQEDTEQGSNGGKSVINYILASVCVLVISGVIFMGYLIFKNSGYFATNNASDDSLQHSVITHSEESSNGVDLDDTKATSTSTVENTADSASKDDIENNKEPDDKGNSIADTEENTDAEYEVHIVKSGDTLSSISTKYYGVPDKYDVIIKYNSLKNENSLSVGQKLKIPKLK